MTRHDESNEIQDDKQEPEEAQNIKKSILTNTALNNVDHDDCRGYNGNKDCVYETIKQVKEDLINNKQKEIDDSNMDTNTLHENTADEIGHSKTRRNRRRALRKICSNFIGYYNNIRGMKSKIDSLAEIVTELEPTIICLVETHMSEREMIEISGYEVYRSDNSTQAGGILIGVLKKVANVTTQIKERNDVGQALWVLLDNTKIKLRIGVIYAPQENKTSANDLKNIYKEIEEQADEARKNKEMLLIVGDFNCKIGRVVRGNDDKVTKGGRMLLKTILKKSLTIINTEMMCKGLWTRVQEGKKIQKSVIDYVIVNQELKQKMQQMTIDEEKSYAAYKIESGQDGNITNKIYSDHNPILFCADIASIATNIEKKKIMTRKSYSKFKQLIKEREVERMFKSGNIQESYDRWTDAVQKAINESKTVAKKKIPNKNVRRLTSIKKGLRKQLNKELNENKRDDLKARINLLRDHITKELKRTRGNAIKKIVENIRNKSNNGNQIWELKKKIDRKPRIQKAIKTKEGINLSGKEDIIKEYERYYKDLLKTKESSTVEEFLAETNVNSQFDIIKTRQEQTVGKTTINEEIVKQAIKSIKLKKAADSFRWKGEWIKLGGEVMVKSLTEMFKKIDTEKEIPSQWEEVIIQSIHKKKGTTLEETERGIFLTNIVSKTYERVKKIQNEAILNNMNPMQMAGRKKRSTTDNIIIINSLIQERKDENQLTYLLFADAVKCFDKLWLKDCILEMINLGMNEQDAWMIYKLNKNTIAKVRTPIGETPKFSVTEVVKQGTVYGPLLCCASLAKVNDIGESLIVLYGEEVEIGMPVYMDDIIAGVDADDIRKAVRKLRLMEIQKKTTFGLKKTVILVVGKGNQQEIHEEVQNGRVTTVAKKDYMGLMINMKGNLEDHIAEIDRKVCNTYSQIMAIGSPTQVSGEYLNVRLVLFEKCLLNSLIYGLAAWGSITEEEIHCIERIHGKYLKQVLQLPPSTPYAPMIIETGLWTAKERLKYITMMLFHEIMNSDDDRKSKEIIKNQIKYKKVKNTIYGKVVDIGEKTSIDVSKVIVPKSKWKKLCKDKIIALMIERLKNDMKNKTKSRFIQHDKWRKKEYFCELEGWIAMDVIKIRLNMWPLKMNYKRNNEQDFKCIKCKIHNDSTEHVIECYSDMNEGELRITNKGRWKDIVTAFQQRSKDDNDDNQ